MKPPTPPKPPKATDQNSRKAGGAIWMKRGRGRTPPTPVRKGKR